MFLNNIPMIIGSLLLGLSYNAHSYEMLIAGRFVIGVACGMYDMSVTHTYYYRWQRVKITHNDF